MVEFSQQVGAPVVWYKGKRLEPAVQLSKHSTDLPRSHTDSFEYPYTPDLCL